MRPEILRNSSGALPTAEFRITKGAHSPCRAAHHGQAGTETAPRVTAAQDACSVRHMTGHAPQHLQGTSHSAAQLASLAFPFQDGCTS